MAERTCTVCGSLLLPRQVKYCRQLCASRAFMQARRADGREAVMRQQMAGRQASYSQQWRERNIEARTCAHCGAHYSVLRTRENRYCSKSCARQSTRKTFPRSAIKVLDCRGGCGVLRTVHGGGGARWTCDRCYDGPSLHEMDSEHRRRARKAAAFIAPVYRRKVFERDGWRCQICRKPVKRTKKVPHPLAPVLDHITPLADGGTHEPRNVQCVHFICNSIKADGAANDQLRLLG